MLRTKALNAPIRGRSFDRHLASLELLGTDITQARRLRHFRLARHHLFLVRRHEIHRL